MPTTTGLATSFITFSRPGASGGGATVTDRDGKIKWAGHNLLTNSESFDASAWVKSLATVAANTHTAPNGTTTADTLTATGLNGWALCNYTSTAVQYTFGVWLKRKTGTGNIQITTDDNLTWATVTITSDWALYTVTQSPTSGTKSAGVRVVTSGDEVYVWGAHLYRSDMQMQLNPAMPAGMQSYYPTTPRNLLGSTEDFSAAYWTKDNILAFGSGSVANAAVAPNGLQTADLIVPNTTSGTHGVSRASTITSSVDTYSIYVKPAGYSKIAIREGNTTGAYSSFNLSGAGSVLQNSGSSTGAITALSDGWYRISIVLNAASSARYYEIWILPDSYTTGSVTAAWTPNGTSGIYLWGAQLSDSASLDTYVPQYGAAVTSAAFYAPRLDFDGATLAAKGLLVEELRQNLILRTEEFEVTPTWGRINVNAPTTNSIIAPSGNATGDIITEDSTTNFHGIQQTVTLTAVAHTYSVYIKQAFGSRNVVLREGVNTGAYATFNVTNGTVVASGVGGTGTITSAGNGWYRCALTFTAVAGSNTFQIMLSDGTGFASYAGNGTSGVALWGAQVEAGSFATSYIPTGAATATRTADVASVSTQAFPYSQTSGTVVVAWRAGQTATGNARLFWLDNTSTAVYDNMITARQGSDSGTTAGVKADVRAGASDQAVINITTPSITAGNDYKLALAVATNDFAFCFGGGTVATDPTGSVPAGIDLMRLGSHRDSTYLNGHIRQITYIPRRLSNAELQSRTA